MKFSLFLLTLVITNAECTAQQSTSIRLDSFVQSLYRYGQLNGTVMAAENGRVIFQKSIGYADFKRKKPNSDNSRFSIGSVSKIFTSVAVLQLKEKGKLRLNEPLVRYLPEFRYPQITIRHLLTHTSGLPDYELYGKLVDKNPQKIFSNKDILPALQLWEKPLAFHPGEKWQYSNTNFSLLALLVERCSGLSFPAYLQKKIFLPAQMTGTYLLTDTTAIPDENRVVNHQYSTLFDAAPQDAGNISKLRWRLFNLSGFSGQGGIVTNTRDLLHFDQALYANKLLKAATLEEAFTPAKLNNGENCNADIGIGHASYGLGWYIFNDTSAGKIVWHGGGVPGAVAIFLRNISRKQVVVMLDNAFSEGIYQNGVNALNIMDDKPVIIRKKSLAREYGADLVLKGTDLAFCRLFQLRSDSAHYYIDESQMNLLAYQLLYEANFDGHRKLALEVFKINTLLFPQSYNVYDSYGEGLYKSGHTKEAIMMYRKALELNPQNRESREALQSILGN